MSQDGSSQSGSSFGSSHATTLFGHGAAGRIFDGLTFLGFQTLKAPLSPLFMRVFLIVEMVQLLSYPLDPVFFKGSPLVPVFSGFVCARDPLLGAVSSAAVISVLVVDSLVVLAFLLQLFLVSRGGTGIRPLFTFVRLTSDLGRILLMPTLYILLSPLVAGQGSSALAVIATIVCVAACAVLFTLSFLTTQELRPSASLYCIMLPRWPVLWATLKYVLIIADFVAKQQFGETTSWGLPIYGVASWICFTVLAIHTILVAPYITKTTNHGTVMLFGTASVLSCITLVSLASAAASFKLALSIVALVCIPVGAVAFTAIPGTRRTAKKMSAGRPAPGM